METRCSCSHTDGRPFPICPTSTGTRGSSGGRRTCEPGKILWDIDEHATLFIEPDTARAGAGRITFVVTGLDALLKRLAAQGIEHEPIETYSNGVRHAKIPDPNGNAIAFAEPPQS